MLLSENVAMAAVYKLEARDFTPSSAAVTSRHVGPPIRT